MGGKNYFSKGNLKHSIVELKQLRKSNGLQGEYKRLTEEYNRTIKVLRVKALFDVKTGILL
jgi:hypothetical protein